MLALRTGIIAGGWDKSSPPVRGRCEDKGYPDLFLTPSAPGSHAGATSFRPEGGADVGTESQTWYGAGDK